MDSRSFKEGARAALPIVLGYLPVGLTFGVLARTAGLTPLEVGLMSLFVYAGASQFLAIEMISKGMAGFSIVVATFFINLRHFLMSSNLSLYFKKTRLHVLGLLSAQLTDESYAVAMSNPSRIENKPRYLFGLQITSQMAWVGGSLAGAFFGPLIRSSGYGFPFALPALFICLLILQIKSIRHFGIMILAGIFSLFFKWALSGNWYILLTALFAAGIGIRIETIRRKGR